MLARFFARRAAAEAEPVAVEIGFGVTVALRPAAGGAAAPPASVRFVGYIDRVDRAPDGSTEIVDYKTGRPRAQDAVDADPQLTAYAYACARGGLVDPATGVVLPPASRLGLYFADAGELVTTTRDEADLAAFEDGLATTVGRIRAREFPARPAPWRCRWCEFRGECTSAAPGAVA